MRGDLSRRYAVAHLGGLQRPRDEISNRSSKSPEVWLVQRKTPGHPKIAGG
jgi:hypothetical protein